MKTYSQTEIWWKLNLGLPARHYEDNALVKKFEKLAWCAEHLAIYGNDTLTNEEIEKKKENGRTTTNLLKPRLMLSQKSQLRYMGIFVPDIGIKAEIQ